MLKSLCLQTFMLAIYAAPYTQHSHTHTPTPIHPQVSVLMSPTPGCLPRPVRIDCPLSQSSQDLPSKVLGHP